MRIYIIGTGMGTPESMTLEALQALQESQLIVGAARLLQGLPETTAETRALIRASEIEAALRESSAQTASVVVSGDVGFYSMANSLYERLADFDVVALPGISSLCYFCAKLHTTWQDARMFSAHGRDANLAGTVRTNEKCLLLTGGKTKAQDLCRLLAEAKLGHLRVHAGESLGYPEERIVTGTAEELAKREFLDLTVLLVENPKPLRAPWTIPSLPDSAFTRGKVPMTKQEVRAVALAKLQLQPASTVWDVGAGTGSVSVECALAAPQGLVYAIERNPEGLQLIQENADSFNCSNIITVEGSAPAALEGLPAPDSVFVGGSGGELEQILRCALNANPQVRIVIAAVTVETLAAATRLADELQLAEPEVVQVAISRGRKAGSYTLMQAANPVHLISAGGSAQ